MSGRPNPFSYTRYARGFHAERCMLEALESRDDKAEQMLERVLRAVGLERSAAQLTT